MVRTAVITTSELSEGDRRFDAFYYAGGGREARQRLEAAGIPLERLDRVAEPPFMGLRFARNYVDDPEHGLPFLGPSEIGLAELTNLPLVSRVRTPNIEQLRIKPGWILISRSGAIGNFAYVRQDMDGLIGSDDLIRIAPREGGAPGGYVYAYLCSAMGLAMLQRSTYGAVIQHIEPEHIADLPVPRLDEETERAIHARIEAAAAKRVEANRMLAAAREQVYEATGLPRYDHAPVGRNLRGARTFTIPSSSLGTRFEARFHDAFVREMEQRIRDAGAYDTLANVSANVYEEHRHKLFDAEENCLPFIGSGEMFAARPQPHRYISRRITGVDSLAVKPGMILIAKSGQIYSILGNTVIVGRSLAKVAVSWHALRIVPDSAKAHPGYLLAFLTLPDYGYGQIASTAYGTSIPELSTDDVRRVLVPMPDRETRDEIGDRVQHAIELRDKANDLEDEAQALLRRALEAATGAAWRSVGGEVGK